MMQRISETTWEGKIPADWFGLGVVLVVGFTPDGLKILDDVIPWEKIDEAREALKKK